jgi:nicotinamidase-related amidase
MKTCLVLIDAQESFRQRHYFTATDLPSYVAAQNTLIEGCLAANVPIVRVFHVDGPKTAGNPFSHESGFVRPLAELHCFEAALTVYKSRHSALVGTGLDVWLTQNGI